MQDITLGETRDWKFTTTDADGVPMTLSGSPVISAYVDNSTTQITAGITLSVDFDGVTGLNNVRVVATSGNGFTTGTSVQLVITTGTVDAVSVVGYVVKEFAIDRNPAWLRLGAPAGASHAVDVAAVKAQTAALEVDTQDIQGRLPAVLVDSRMSSTIDATGFTTAVRALVNAEVVDAVNVDTMSEMSNGAPPLAPTMRQALNYLYRWMIRNKKTVDSSSAPTVETVFADDGTTPIFKRNISDSANVTTFDETAAGS